MHKDQLPQLSAAIEMLNKRGRSHSRKSEAHKKRQICLEASFRTKFNQERARQCYTRWKKISEIIVDILTSKIDFYFLKRFY